MAYEEIVKYEKFKHIYFKEFEGTTLNRKPYNGRFTHKGVKYDIGWHKTAREAAIEVDKKLISLGAKPVNILKVKK